MGLFSSLLGTSSPSAPAIQQTDPRYLNQAESDVGAVRTARDRDITGLTQAGQLTIAELDRQRGLASDQSMGDLQTNLNTSIQSGATQGGISSGSIGRLARQNVRAGAETTAGINSKYQDLNAQAAIGDYGQQQDIKNQALFAVPQQQLGIVQGANNATGMANKANMAQYQADYMNNQAKKSTYTGLAKLAGTAVGAAYGGPTGAMVGGAAGGAAGNMLF